MFVIRIISSPSSSEQAEVFPVDIKLDYKPRRVDYRALREGRTIELMNFFHFDGAEMTLRHITVKGVSLCSNTLVTPCTADVHLDHGMAEIL